MIGTLAALVHWSSAVGAIYLLGIRPAWGNFLGWLVAVSVSFLGHYFFTFRLAQTNLLSAARKFLVISLSGFVINELAFVYLLAATGLPSWLLLALVLAGVAILTFITSRSWAFRGRAGGNG